MANREDINLCLVLEVKKHQCLYNNGLPEYSRGDVTNKAWGKISGKLNLSVNDCKEKWRNIRSAYLRSMKGLDTCGITSKVKRPYYLSEHLQFVIPFMKPYQNTNAEDRRDPDWSDNAEESNQGDTTGNVSQHANSNANSTDTRRKRPMVDIEVEQSFEDYEAFRRSQREEDRPISKNPMHNFFLSLLPEFETMSLDHQRYFKIEVMLLIDRIKKNERRGMSDNSFTVDIIPPSPTEQVKAEMLSPNSSNRVCDDNVE